MKINKRLFIFLKIAVSFAFLVLVFSQLNLTEIIVTLKRVKFWYLLLALILFLGSQLFSVVRLGLCFKCIQISIPFFINAKLYLLGMFYNFFIPGGIGGDAYKVYWLNKTYTSSIKNGTSAVFIDRVFGLIAIGVCLLLFTSSIELNILSNQILTRFVLIGLVIIGLLIAYQLIKKIFPDFESIFSVSVVLSLMIQGLQLLSVLNILYALNIESNCLIYLILFLASSITSVLSFAGIGMREAVFFYGAKYFLFDENTSTTVGLCFNLITLFVSLLGIVFLFKPLGVKK